MNERQKAHPLLLTLVKIQRKYNKDYSWPAQEKIIELMDLRQGIRKSRATINRWLRVIEDGKYLMRTRRIKRHPLYGMVFKSTLYKVTIKGYRLLARAGVDVSKEIAKAERWLEEISRDHDAIKNRKKLDSVKRNPKHRGNLRVSLLRTAKKYLKDLAWVHTSW